MFCAIVLQTVVKPRTPAVIIYLQVKLVPFSVEFPTEGCPYHYLGCSLAGFTSFHLVCFQTSYVTVAL